MKLLFSTFAFFVGLAVTAGLLSRVVPAPAVPVLSAKLAHLAEHGDQFDTLILGSSRLYRGLDPAVLEATLASAGISIRSFNLSADGLRPPEDSFVLEQALKGRRKPLRWVLLEAQSIPWEFEGENADTVRGTWWRDGPRTRLVLGRVLAGEDPGRRKGWAKAREWTRSGNELLAPVRLALPRALHCGVAVPLVRAALGLPIPTEPLPAMPAGGFEKGGPEAMPERRRAAYDKELAERQRQPTAEAFGDAASQANLARIAALVRQFGGTLVLLVPPTTSEERFHPAPPLRPALHFFDFSDPDLHPDLYRPENRRDRDHLNGPGAAAWTRKVAAQLVAVEAGR